MSTTERQLARSLVGNVKAGLQWKAITPVARRDFISWIDSAKQPQTRVRRIEKARSMLAAGKRRPCCYALVPMNLYTALAAHKGAQQQWKSLTPVERRDFVDWIDVGATKEMRAVRIAKTCALLAAGKRHL